MNESSLKFNGIIYYFINHKVLKHMKNSLFKGTRIKIFTKVFFNKIYTNFSFQNHIAFETKFKNTIFNFYSDTVNNAGGAHQYYYSRHSTPE